MYSECIELMGDIVAIYPLPAGTLAFDVPFQVQATSISASSIILRNEPISISNLSKCEGFATIYSEGTPARTIEIESGATAKRSDKSSSAGYYTSVKVSAKTYESTDVIQLINEWREADYIDVVLLDSAGNLFILRGSDNATSIQCDANVPRSTPNELSIEVECPNGIQPITA